MTTATFDDDASLAAAKKWRYAGWALILAGFAVPQAMLASQGGNAFLAGDELARSCGQLLLPAVIAWFVTRKGTILKKAKGTFVVGLVMLLTSVSIAYGQQRNQVDQRAYMQKMLEMRQASDAKLLPVINKLNSMTIPDAFTPSAFIVPANRAAARTALAEYKSLVFERKALMAEAATEVEKVLSSLPAGEFRKGAQEGAENARRKNQRMYGELEPAQIGYAEASDALLKWADGQQIQLSKEGQLLFANQKALDEFQRLVAALQKAEERLNAAVAQSNAAQLEIAADDAKLMKQAKEIAK